MKDTTETREFRCCEKICATPFCPLCGKPTPTRDIHGLLKHVQGTLSANTAALDRTIRYQKEHPPEEGQEYIDSSRRKKKERTVAKWQSWEVALVDVIQKAAEAPLDTENET